VQLVRFVVPSYHLPETRVPDPLAFFPLTALVQAALLPAPQPDAYPYEDEAAHPWREVGHAVKHAAKQTAHNAVEEHIVQPAQGAWRGAKHVAHFVASPVEYGYHGVKHAVDRQEDRAREGVKGLAYKTIDALDRRAYFNDDEAQYAHSPSSLEYDHPVSPDISSGSFSSISHASWSGYGDSGRTPLPPDGSFISVMHSDQQPSAAPASRIYMDGSGHIVVQHADGRTLALDGNGHGRIIAARQDTPDVDEGAQEAGLVRRARKGAEHGKKTHKGKGHHHRLHLHKVKGKHGHGKHAAGHKDKGRKQHGGGRKIRHSHGKRPLSVRSLGGASQSDWEQLLEGRDLYNVQESS
jgi:hypothetical protein